MSGPIPPELGQLSSLTSLWLASNQLSGPIPPELGQLSNLTTLVLHVNQLSGPIPRELGQLSSLTSLWLGWNQLSGSIPRELGQLSNLTTLALSHNHLTGPIPRELGQLLNLENLWLEENELSGVIPPALDQLSNLGQLRLNNNHLTGPIPRSLLQRFSREFSFAGNRLRGVLPAAPLVFPENPQENGNAAHHSLSYYQGPLEWTWNWQDAPVRYQRPIAGRTAVLAVRIDHESAQTPRVVTSVLDADDNLLTERLLEAALPSTTSTAVGQWRTEYVFDLPGDLNRPGHRLVHIIDPDDEMPETDEGDNEGAPIALQGETPPRFRITFIPMHRPGEPPPAVNPSALMLGVQAYLPIADDYFAQVGDPVETTAVDESEALDEVWALWNAQADANEFYYGICPLPDCRGGVAILDGRAAASHAGGFIVPHELGHNFGLGHAPCGALGDPNYPYADGGIGPHGGWQIVDLAFAPPNAGYRDLMTYCSPIFISDYHFGKAADHWLSAAAMAAASTAPVRAPLGLSRSAGSFAISGRVDAAGHWRLTHAQESHKAPRTPAPDGAFTLIVQDAPAPRSTGNPWRNSR